MALITVTPIRPRGSSPTADEFYRAQLETQRLADAVIAALGGLREMSRTDDAPKDGSYYARLNGAWSALASGMGDVAGPGGAVAGNFATYSGVTGKVIKDSGLSAASFDAAGTAAAVST